MEETEITSHASELLSVSPIDHKGKGQGTRHSKDKISTFSSSTHNRLARSLLLCGIATPAARAMMTRHWPYFLNESTARMVKVKAIVLNSPR